MRVFRAPHLELSASRPFPVYADGEHLTDLPASLRVLPRALSVIVPRRRGLSARGRNGALFGAKRAAARAVGAASRASGRGGGTTLPGRVLLRLAPDAIARLGSGLDRGATLVSATNGKTTTAGMIAAMLAAEGRDPVHNRAGSNMTWGVATALLEQRGERGAVRGRRGLAAEGRGAARPLADRARQPLPRPARPLRRDRDAGRRVGGDGRRARRAHPLRPQRRRPADRRPRPRRRASAAARASSTSGSRTPRRRCPSSSTPSTPSTAAAAATPTPTSAPSSATSATTPAPTAAPSGRAPDVAATAIELHGMERLDASTVRTPAGELEPRAAPARPLQRLQRARRGRRRPRARRRPGADRRRRWPTMRAAFGRVETIEIGGKPVSILLIKNPAGRQRGPAHAAARGRRRGARPLDRAQRPDRRRPRRLLDLGRRLRAARRRACGGSPAPAPGRRRWRCG